MKNKKQAEKAINLIDNLIGMFEDNQENDYDWAIKYAIKSLEAWDKILDELNQAISDADEPYNDISDAYQNGLVKAKWILLKHIFKEVEDD